MDRTGVSPVVGIILLTAVTVALVSLAAVFVFDVGESSSSGVGTATVSAEYTSESSIDVQLVKQGAADTIVVQSALGTEYILDETGDSVTLLNQDSNQTPSVLSEKNGKRTVLQDIPPRSFTPDIVVAGGSEGQYSQVSTALSNAEDGDIIVLKRGVYYENIDVRTPNVTLVGESGTVIADNTDDAAVIDIRASGVQVSNINVNASSSQGGSAAEYSVYASQPAKLVNVGMKNANTSSTGGSSVEQITSSELVPQKQIRNTSQGVAIPSELTQEWVETFGSGATDIGRSVDIDSDENVVVAGSSDIGGTPAIQTIKYDSSGTRLWNKTYNSGNTDKARSVSVDSDDNIIVTGYTKNGLEKYWYTVKYDSSGTKLWSQTYDPGDYSYDIAIDSSGDIIIIGEGNNNWHIVKYASNGTRLWNQSYDLGADGAGIGVAVDSDDEILAAGWTDRNGTKEYYTAKYTEDGENIWSRTFNSGGSDGPLGVAVDSNENAVVTGGSDGSGTYDYYTIKYSNSGNKLWSRRLNITDGRDVAWRVTVDRENSVYLTGKNGNDNIYTVKYDSSGRKQWVETYTAGTTNRGHGVSVTQNGTLYVAGYIDDGTDKQFVTIKYSG